jgi:hypothetical protein
MRTILRRAGLGLAIAACFSVGALAHGPASDETRIDVRTKFNTVETVVVQDLGPGEIRSLSTAMGNPALVTRTDKGLKLELAGETFDVALPDPEHLDAADLPAGAKVVRIEKHERKQVAEGDTTEKKTVVVKRSGTGSEADAAAAEALADAADPGPLADGQRIRVIRQVRREEEQVER